MDKLVMLVKLLLVAVCIISECECYLYTLDQAMCPRYGKTVVYALVEQVEYEDANGDIWYRMLLEKIYKKEEVNSLSVSYDQRITMRFPSDEMECGQTFPEDITKGYIFVGNVNYDGVLFSDLCQYARPAHEVFKNSSNQDLLSGRRKPSCR